MFHGNTSLRSAGEKIEYTPEQIKEYIRCSQDILYFAEKYFHIVTIDEGKKLIELYEFQKKILKVYVDPSPDKRHLILLVPRQSGKTTVTTIYALHYILFNTDKTVAILANKQAIAVDILKRVKLAYENLPLWLQQGVNPDGWNSLSLILENGSRVVTGSTSGTSISGMTISVLILDEFSKVPAHVAENFITSTYPVISSGKSSKIIMISTPYGLNLFYDFWSGAVRGKNGYFPMKVKYDEVPGRDEEWKVDMIKKFGLQRFMQEFSTKFLGSSNTLVDADVLEESEIMDPIEIKWKGMFKIYEQPIKNCLYTLGIDSAKGVGGNYSVIQVLKIINNLEIEQVAVYRNNQIDTHRFAQICINVSKFYNGAYMMIENNGEGGEVAQTIWYEYEYDYICNMEKQGIGIRSDKQSKLKANLNLKQYFDERWLKIVDKETIVELSRYAEVKPNIFKSESESVNDDCVTSLIWGTFYVKTPYFDSKDIKNINIEDEYKLEDNSEDVPIMYFDAEGMNNIDDDGMDMFN